MKSIIICILVCMIICIGISWYFVAISYRNKLRSKERILCAAIIRKTKKSCTNHYHENDIYDIELGYRHCDILSRFKGEVSTRLVDQGFYTSKGRYVDRLEAARIAYEAGQIETRKFMLYSEDLY